jgi:hypothetical protein
MEVYKTGNIYKITSPTIPGIYIGSTSQELKKRMCVHKAPSNGTSSKPLFANSDAVIELIESFEYRSKKDLLRREGWHIVTTPTCVNRSIAGRTREEYCTDNREYILQRHREYNEAHREELQEKGRVYYHENAEASKAKTKRWFANNREKWNAYMRERARMARLLKTFSHPPSTVPLSVPESTPAPSS